MFSHALYYHVRTFAILLAKAFSLLTIFCIFDLNELACIRVYIPFGHILYVEGVGHHLTSQCLCRRTRSIIFHA